MCIQTATDGKYARKKKPVKFILNIKQRLTVAETPVTREQPNGCRLQAPDNFFTPARPSWTAIYNHMADWMSAFVRVARSLFQGGRPDRFCPLTSFFFREHVRIPAGGTTVALVMSAMTRGRVPEISARHTQILRSHLTQRDGCPSSAFHRFYRSAQRASLLNNKKKNTKKTLKHFQGTRCSHEKTQNEGEAGIFNLTFSFLRILPTEDITETRSSVVWIYHCGIWGF